MRNKILLSIIAVVTLFMAYIATSAALAEDGTGEAANSVVVYYFHTNYRCANCYNMEQWTKELMETRFKDQVAAGKLSLKIFNTDEKASAHFLTDYKLYTKSVVLSLVKGGREVRYDNLAKIWDYLRSKAKFQEYIGCEIDKYLKEL